MLVEVTTKVLADSLHPPGTLQGDRDPDMTCRLSSDQLLLEKGAS